MDLTMCTRFHWARHTSRPVHRVLISILVEPRAPLSPAVCHTPRTASPPSPPSPRPAGSSSGGSKTSALEDIISGRHHLRKTSPLEDITSASHYPYPHYLERSGLLTLMALTLHLTILASSSPQDCTCRRELLDLKLEGAHLERRRITRIKAWMILLRQPSLAGGKFGPRRRRRLAH